MAVLRLKHVENAPIDGQAVQLVHIEGLDTSGGTSSGGSSEYVLPEASTTTLGGVTVAADEDFAEYLELETA